MYQMPGSPYSRCISFESRGLPEAVRLPARAQRVGAGLRLAAGAGWGTGNSLCARRHRASMLRLITSSRQVVVRSRNMYRQISRESTTLHGRGW